jgi:hypothetical protein
MRAIFIVAVRTGLREAIRCGIYEAHNGIRQLNTKATAQ